MRQLIAAVLIAIAPVAGPAWAAEWTVVPEKSTLGFSGTQFGSPFSGRFKQFDAAIRFDPQALADSRVAVTIAMASADTANAERDGAVKGSDWFAVAEHPTARFETTAFRRLDGDRYMADALLTIRGTTKPVALPFTLTIDGNTARAAGDLTINRTDYGVGSGQFATGQMVGLDVTVRVDLLATARTP